MGRFPRNFIQKQNMLYNTTINVNSSEIVPNRKEHIEDLRTIFDKLIDTEKEGKSKGIIDKQEAQNANGRIYFVDENMDVNDFIRINIDIYEQSGELNMGKSDTGKLIVGRKQNSTLSKEIGNVIKNIINSGQFEEKKDAILAKLKYLDVDTFNELKALLPEEKWKELDEKYQNP